MALAQRPPLVAEPFDAGARGDPAGVGATDAERLAAFEQAYERLHRRISAFVALPVETMAPAELRAALQAIGQQQDVPA